MHRYASPLFFGPQAGDDLLAWVTHLYTEEEAEMIQHLPLFRGRTVPQLASRTGRSRPEVTRIMEHVAGIKKAVLAFGTPRKYAIMPVAPGTFELVMMTPDPDSLNEWHRTFSELFERLWDRGFMIDYILKKSAAIRYAPVSRSQSESHAWPSDRLEEIFQHYSLFAVTHCQCRMAMRMLGRGCDKPMENCMLWGPFAQGFLDRNMARRIDHEEALAIKRDAEQHGCVTWLIGDVYSKHGGGSCSCCGCCCHALRTVTDFNAPGMIIPPHYIPILDSTACIACGKCVEQCPMNAWTSDNGSLHYNRSRCIGCGLCVVACRTGALRLETVHRKEPKQPAILSYLARSVPALMTNAARVWLRRHGSRGQNLNPEN